VYASVSDDVPVRFSGYGVPLAEDLFNACGFVAHEWLVFPTYCYAEVDSFALPINFNISLTRDTSTLGNEPLPPFDLTVTVVIIQPTIYDQIRSLNNSKSQFDQIFSVPNLYSSNVEGGLGVVGGAIFREFRVRLE
jgi:hypothetical protein